MPGTQFFRRKHPAGALRKRRKEKLNSLWGCCCHSTKEMHLTQCSGSTSSKGSSKNIISECCPKRAPQCKKNKIPLESKSTSEEKDSYDDMV